MKDLFYQVVLFERKRRCKFNFSLVKGSEHNIHGSAVVNFAKPQHHVKFDPHSDTKLTQDEKQYIVAYVLKYMDIGL